MQFDDKNRLQKTSCPGRKLFWAFGGTACCPRRGQFRSGRTDKIIKVLKQPSRFGNRAIFGIINRQPTVLIEISHRKSIAHRFFPMAVSARSINQVMIHLVKKNKQGQLIGVFRFDVIARFPPRRADCLGSRDAGFYFKGITIFPADVNVNPGRIRCERSGVNRSAGISHRNLQGLGGPVTGRTKKHGFDSIRIEFRMIDNLHFFTEPVSRYQQIFRTS